MRIISLYQPYATLVVLGLKRFETRSWNTNYRGKLGIHATANMPGWCKGLLATEPFRSALLQKGVLPSDLYSVRGQIIGTVELVDTMKTDSWLLNQPYNPELYSDNEFQFGDYSLGRYAWRLAKPEEFLKPIDAKGSQGFWNYDIPTYHIK